MLPVEFQSLPCVLVSRFGTDSPISAMVSRLTSVAGILLLLLPAAATALADANDLCENKPVLARRDIWPCFDCDECLKGQ